MNTPQAGIGALAAACLLGLTGCSAGAADDTRRLTVFAAASLKVPFTQLAGQFEAAHPGTDVVFTFAGSSDLVTQISEGAPADVFASADTRTMDRLTEAGLAAGTPQDFATNTLAIAVPAGNPDGIDSFQDLASPGLQVVVCAEQVPCGAATQKAEQATGTTLSPVSEENSVTDVLGKVLSGQADAGVVYTTDVHGAPGQVEGVNFPEAAQAPNTYPITAVTDTSRPELAQAFINTITGEQGQKALAEAGFEP